MLAWIAAAQEQGPAPAFDVASVKLAAGVRTGGYRHQITPTSLTMLHVSMGHCLRLAYDIDTAYQLVGPRWLDPPTENEYDVVAKVTRPATEEQIKAMLRTLLAERFQLRAHRETRDLPAYALLAVKASAALRRSDGKGKPRVSSGDKPYSYRFENLTMPQLALQLGPPWTTRPVVDQTALAGSYDFALDVSRYVAGPGHRQADSRLPGRDRPGRGAAAGSPGTTRPRPQTRPRTLSGAGRGSRRKGADAELAILVRPGQPPGRSPADRG